MRYAVLFLGHFVVWLILPKIEVIFASMLALVKFSNPICFYSCSTNKNSRLPQFNANTTCSSVAQSTVDKIVLKHHEVFETSGMTTIVDFLFIFLVLIKAPSWKEALLCLGSSTE